MKKEMGEETKNVTYEIIKIEKVDYGEDVELSDIEEFIKVLNANTSLFSTGIKKRLIALNSKLQETSKDKDFKKYLRECYEEAGIKAPSEPTLRDWLRGDLPGYGTKYRGNIYRLCFALKMNEKETEEFFAFCYLDRAFNWKVIEECIYYFCLKNKLSYSKSQEMIEALSKNSKKKYVHDKLITLADENGETNLIGDKLRNIESEEGLIEYIAENSADVAENSVDVAENSVDVDENSVDKILLKKTAMKEIESLLIECKNVLYDSANEFPADMNPEEISNEKLLNCIYNFSSRKGIAKNRYEVSFPKYVTDNWPLIQNLTNMGDENKEPGFLRKLLIILNFYHFFTDLFLEYPNNVNVGEVYPQEDKEKKSKEFEIETNELLQKCGYNELYYRNPFDLLFFYCIHQDNPITAFQKLMEQPPTNKK